MSNRDSPDGLRAVRRLGGGAITLAEHTIASGYGTTIGTGDLVKHSGTGKNVERCAAGERAAGVFAGCKFVTADGEEKYSRHWPAAQTIKSGTKAIAYVYEDPNIVFEIQADGALAETAIGNVADIVTTAANATTGNSDMELGVASLSAAGSAQLKILELVPRAGNDYGANARVHVLINEHELNAAMTAV